MIQNIENKQNEVLIKELKGVRNIYNRLKKQLEEESLQEGQFLKIFLPETNPLRRLGIFDAHINVSDIVLSEESAKEFESKLDDLKKQFENL